MKILLGVGILFLSLVTLVIFAWPSPKKGAVPFVYGRDVCQHCRMHIAEGGFGAELRDPAGELTKYDDIGCMMLAMHKTHREFPEVWVEDHTGKGFIPFLSATLVRGNVLGTPMGYGVLAFKEEQEALSFIKEHKTELAEIVSLEVLLKDRGRFERVAHNEKAPQEAHR